MEPIETADLDAPQPLTLKDLELTRGDLEQAASYTAGLLTHARPLYRLTDRQRQQLELAIDLAEMAQRALEMAVEEP